MKEKGYVVKRRKGERCGDWIAFDAVSPSEAAKKAARSWGLPGNVWLLVAEGEDGFNHSGEFEVYTATGKKVEF